MLAAHHDGRPRSSSPKPGRTRAERASVGIRTRDPHLTKMVRYHCATEAEAAPRSRNATPDCRSPGVETGGPIRGPGLRARKNGRSRIRTCVASATILQTVPFSHSGIRPCCRSHWSRREESNPQPTVYKTVALPLSYVGKPRPTGTSIAVSRPTCNPRCPLCKRMRKRSLRRAGQKDRSGRTYASIS